MTDYTYDGLREKTRHLQIKRKYLFLMGLIGNSRHNPSYPSWKSVVSRIATHATAMVEDIGKNLNLTMDKVSIHPKQPAALVISKKEDKP